MLEELRELMNKSIRVLGKEDPITVSISQRLDEVIVKEQKKLK